MRSFEYFKYLHLGIISEIKRKSLPEIAKVVGLETCEGLNHFLTKSPWSVEELKNRRLELILKVINGEEIIKEKKYENIRIGMRAKYSKSFTISFATFVLF